MPEKKCFKCQSIKDVSEFYKHGQMSDGYLGKCKECSKKDTLDHRTKNIDTVREYDRQRNKLPHRIKLNSDIGKSYRTKHPLRYHATNLLNNAIRDGKIKKEPCSICGSTYRIHGHHEDYYKPLDVIWLCTIHHKELHNGPSRPRTRTLRKELLALC